jgi:hypothetical protein
MRRRPGIQGLQKRQAEQGQCKALGDELASAQLARMQQQLTAFKNSLQEFAFKHRCVAPSLRPSFLYHQPHRRAVPGLLMVRGLHRG